MSQRILAIDDEPHMLILLERIIGEKTEYKITTLGNSLEVPELLKEQKFDLIVTDLKMPGMDGLDILKHIKDTKRSEEVIIMTAFGSLNTALDALNEGVFDYITKPFKKERIILTIDRAMKWQRLKKASLRMADIFDFEPFSVALENFKEEYIRRLSLRSEGDEDEMIKRSGLTTEDFDKVHPD
ncbi:MAG: response regulator [candidate division Zixibacteria bacterium]|nr:response regulator [candidate division Zixibacteria bacterium]